MIPPETMATCCKGESGFATPLEVHGWVQKTYMRYSLNSLKAVYIGNIYIYIYGTTIGVMKGDTGILGNGSYEV